eukprot:2019836-Lingulodinium_polyedra.AAC.1
MGECERQIYGGPPPDARQLLGLSADELLQLEGSVYGLRDAPKAWYAKVAKDLEAFGAAQRPLDRT